jgi:hypothetical protein
MAFQNEYLYMNEEAINPLLKCEICSKPYVDPVVTADERRGCRKCLNQNLSGSELLTPITEKIILRMLADLLVRCEKCGEIDIRRGDLQEHNETECMLAMVSCTSSDLKCRWRGTRIQLGEHLDICVFEPLRPALGSMIEENKRFKEQINQLTTLVNKLRQKNAD